jgi:hypothetical protein
MRHLECLGCTTRLYFSVTFSVMSDVTILSLHLCACVLIQLNQSEPFWGYPILTPCGHRSPKVKEDLESGHAIP